MDCEIENHAPSISPFSSPTERTTVDIAAFIEGLSKQTDKGTRDVIEYYLMEGLQREKMVLNTFDSLRIASESSKTKNDVVWRSELLRSTLEQALATVKTHRKLRRLERELDDARHLEVRLTSLCVLASLPFELWGKIFQMVVEGDGGRGLITAVTISHVCRLFRYTALRYPSLWSTIDVSYADYEYPLSLDLLKSCLERGKQLPLQIRMEFDDYNGFSPRNTWNCKYLELLVQHSHRWRSLYIELYEFDTWMCATPFRSLSFLDVPNLLHITITSRFPWSGRTAEQGFLCNSWNAPRLRSLRVSNYLPFSPDQMACFQNIEQAEIQFSSEGFWNPERYLGALSKLSSLSQLNLVIRRVIPFNSNVDITPISMDNVQTYRVELRSLNDTEETQKSLLVLSRIFGALYCPNVREMSLVVADCSEQYAAPLLSALSPSFGHRNDYPSLADLSLSLSLDCMKVTNLRLPLETAPNLRQLSMSISSDFDITLSRPSSARPLKTLRLSNPYATSAAHWLRSFIGCTSWPLFETFIFEIPSEKVLAEGRGADQMAESPSSLKVIRSEDIASWCSEILDYHP
ncbi:hypothetical protein SCHPADRAFT_120127 [Schizopora paradoxa]|uniref:F-box domain-containing protein n=1 Tax=Schizopora paradoxa TaxID=27342 RepID=A0A0H2S9Y6_9AGAM|nr:hypothetical protein SCHPADRAFT_120127 [Schizopora paradoxa]